MRSAGPSSTTASLRHAILTGSAGGIFLLAAVTGMAGPADRSTEFTTSIRPVLETNCSVCHNSKNPRGPADFLQARTVQDMEKNRGLWHTVAANLRSRAMPPVASKLTEEDRLRVASWVDEFLRETACDSGAFAGPAVIRRLNRREYHNTVRDLLGVDFNAADLFPADNAGGAGFDTNGETLYISPLLVERYVEAARLIADSVIVTPNLVKTMKAADLQPVLAGDVRTLEPGKDLSISLPIYATASYKIQLAIRGNSNLKGVSLKVDKVEAAQFAPVSRFAEQFVLKGVVQPAKEPPPATANPAGARGRMRNPLLQATVPIERGTRLISLAATEGPVSFESLTVEQQPEEVTPEKRAAHFRLLGLEPGELPLNERTAAERKLLELVRKAYRRPVQPADVDRFMAVYDRSAERGDPYEERVKLALRAVLVSPEFLFRIETKHKDPGMYPLNQYELATRLSYFLWSTAPDDELTRLAEEGRLQDPAILAQQVDRILDDNRSRAFATAFVGQWLGTQDLGSRVVPLVTSVASFYNAESAADLRAEPTVFFQNLVAENGSLLDLLDSNYSFLTERLAKFYQVEDKVKVTGADFRRIEWPDDRRGGLLGMGAVLALSSNRMQTSPVVRGAWTLETLLGTPVPPPPPGVPPLDANPKTNLSTREKLNAHRNNQICATCHRMMDPIGLGLENFDWIGRWRENETNGKPIDSSGQLPTGERFAGPVELRHALMSKKDDFLRLLTAKLIGYALGRTLQDGDSCTIQHIVDRVAKDNYRARTMMREIVLSDPFRNTQGGVLATVEANPPTRRIKPRIVSCIEDGTCMPKKPDAEKPPAN